MKNKHLNWLYQELPKLIEENIISKNTSQEIREYYNLDDKRNKEQNLLLIFSILGAVLIGSGIILLLAHNWAQLTRLIRTIIIFTGLVGAQSLAAWVLLKRRKSISWREGSATFLTFIVGSAIALIGQTYNLPADLNNFLLTWMLLSLPLVYLMETTIPAVIYLAGISWWGIITGSQFSLLIWLLAALIIPYYIKQISVNKRSRKVSILSWALGLTGIITISVTLDLYNSKLALWRLIYLNYFVVLYLLGQELELKTKVFRGAGLIGTYIVMYQLGSFTKLGYFKGKELLEGNLTVYFLIFLLWAVIAYLLIRNFNYKKKNRLLIGVAPIVLLLGALFSQFFAVSLIIYNAYLLLIGLGILLIGLELEIMKLSNLGVLLIALQIVGRFFLLDISFVWRGIVFLLVGIGFLVANLIINRQLKE